MGSSEATWASSNYHCVDSAWQSRHLMMPDENDLSALLLLLLLVSGVARLANHTSK